MLKLTIVVATVLLNVVKSQPISVNVEVTVNGVKVPISQDHPQAMDLNHRSGIIDPGMGYNPLQHLQQQKLTEAQSLLVSFGFLA